jgi:tRNA uridine 5-carboxymethylaminomethyl modification enzyme
MPHGYALGLIPRTSLDEMEARVAARGELSRRLDAPRVKVGSESLTLKQMLLRPAVTWQDLAKVAPWVGAYEDKVLTELEIEIKYQGYIARDCLRAQDLRQKEGRRIPVWLDFQRVPGLSLEAQEKLGRIKPASIGQAARVPGITPADVSSVLIHMAKRQGLKVGNGPADDVA